MIGRLENYLVGEEGYLKSDLSNGKVIMLSGKWGSGKTHFWQNRIATEEFKKSLHKKRETYAYVSLYGKSSIEEIENDIFGQIYFDAIGGENIVTKTASTFTKYTKRYGGFSSIFDFSKLAEASQQEQQDNIERTALERLNNGGIICFDDFERKSKSIDLNDLFGFITQLTLNFNCKIVIILNDDVFQGKDKKIFSSVKEKTVSKFLYYSPSIEELFHLIYEENGSQKYNTLNDYKEVILKAILETQELNARIYIQVLDNLVEWVNKKIEDMKTPSIIRCLVLTNINFILYHTIFQRRTVEINRKTFILHSLEKLENEGYTYLNNIRQGSTQSYALHFSLEQYIIYIHNKIKNLKENSDEKIKMNIKFLEDNIEDFKSDYFINKLQVSAGVDDDIFEEINNFVRTGILD